MESSINTSKNLNKVRSQQIGIPLSTAPMWPKGHFNDAFSARPEINGSEGFCLQMPADQINTPCRELHRLNPGKREVSLATGRFNITGQRLTWVKEMFSFLQLPGKDTLINSFYWETALLFFLFSKWRHFYHQNVVLMIPHCTICNKMG